MDYYEKKVAHLKLGESVFEKWKKTDLLEGLYGQEAYDMAAKLERLQQSIDEFDKSSIHPHRWNLLFCIQRRLIDEDCSYCQENGISRYCDYHLKVGDNGIIYASLPFGNGTAVISVENFFDREESYLSMLPEKRDVCFINDMVNMIVYERFHEWDCDRMGY